jgi:hypothetical protein
MAATYGQAPSAWLLSPAARTSPEGQIFAYDFDRTVFAIATTYDAEQATMTRLQAEHEKRVKASGGL